MPRKCIFCDINPADFRVEYQDDDIAIFHDISPSARIHLLAIPLKHISTVNNLTKEDISLIKNLEEKSAEVLRSSAQIRSIAGEEPQRESARFGFHVPPFNSVLHLHMHVLVPPFKTLRAWKYSDKCPWFVSVDSLLKDLQSK